MSLTDSLTVLTALFAVAIPRRPRHTTFENNKLCEKCHMSYYHSTYALTSFAAFICILS